MRVNIMGGEGHKGTHGKKSEKSVVERRWEWISVGWIEKKVSKRRSRESGKKTSVMDSEVTVPDGTSCSTLYSPLSSLSLVLSTYIDFI